jgi:hypothetical protein
MLEVDRAYLTKNSPAMQARPATMAIGCRPLTPAKRGRMAGAGILISLGLIAVIGMLTRAPLTSTAQGVLKHKGNSVADIRCVMEAPVALTPPSMEEGCEIQKRTTMIVGYDARVSTEGQSLEAQEAALKAESATRIFAEKVSGARADEKRAVLVQFAG